MAQQHWYYSVEDYSDEPYAIEGNRYLSLEDAYDREQIVKACAKDFHYNHDGWECTWPLIVRLHRTATSPAEWSFSVDREVVPEFTAIAVA